MLAGNFSTVALHTHHIQNDAFYKSLLPKNEGQMNRSAKELADEALQSLSKKSNP